MWSKEEAQPAQRVAHNRLGRLVSHLRSLVPPLVLFYLLFNVVNTQQRCERPHI